MNLENVMRKKCAKEYEILVKHSSFLKNIPFRHGVFGGALRSWFFDKKPRDIDIAVDCSLRDFNIMASQIEHTRNSFGGIKILGDIEIDVWPLSETWNLQHKNVYSTFENLARFASFNVDCVVLEIGSSYRLIDMGFTKGLVDGFVEINYEPNPLPASNALRGLRLCYNLNLKPGKMLRKYVTEHLTENNISELCKKYNEPSDKYLRMLKGLQEECK